MKNIREMHKNERPREKLVLKGATNLSDWELIAVILGRGSKGIPVTLLARKILALLDDGDPVPDLERLRQIPGMGLAKASLITAAMEFARRRIRPVGLKIGKPVDILPLIRHYADRKQEYLLCSSLNGANEVIATRVVTVGLVDQNQVHPREVFADPITDRASAVVVAHNHPSGGVRPSEPDLAVTQRLLQSGKLLGIPLVDHIIFTHDDYFSFAEKGLLSSL